MPVYPSDVSPLLKDGLKMVFEEAYAGLEPQWARIAMRVESAGESEEYGWLGAVPGLREFHDERMIKGIRRNGFIIRNRTWEATIGIKRAAIEDEQYGQLKLRVQQMADDASRHMDRLVFGLLADGFTEPGYDGAPFFGTHTEGDSGSQSNAGSDPLSITSLQAALTAMRRFKDDRGRPIGVAPNVLVVPPEQEWTAREILASSFYPGVLTGTDNQKLAANVLKGSLGLVVSPELTDPDAWFLLDTTHAFRPLIAQIRATPEFEALEAQSESGFLRDEYLYGVRSRHAAGYGAWYYAYGSAA